MRELTIDSGKANLWALLFFVPIGILFGLPFYFLWHQNINLYVEIIMLKEHIFYVLMLLLGFMLLHELLHALAYLILTKGDFRNISFGLIWKNMTPYCHYKKPINISKYRIAVFAPGFLTGLIPLSISLANGSFELFIGALFFTLGALGDFMILWLLRKEHSQVLIQDHPEKIGCIVLDDKPKK